MPRFLAGLLAALVVAAVGTQLLLPRYLEGRVADRLESEGGRADVSLSAFPALRLLFRDGDRLDARGSGLGFEGRGERHVLNRLDGFGEVHVALRDVRAGPLRVGRFALDRPNDESDYRVTVAGRAVPRDVASFLGQRAAGTFGGLLGGLAVGALPGGGTVAVPVLVHAELRSRGGAVDVVDAQASLGGLPAGPLAALAVGLVVREL